MIQDLGVKGTQHMVNDTNFEPQRTNNYEVQITGLDEIKTDMNGNKVPMDNASSTITLSTNSFDAPSISVDPITVRYGNSSIKYAGVPSFGDASIVINDYIGLNTERILSAWYAQVYNPNTEEIGYAVDYKKTAYLIEYDTKYSKQTRTWRMEGVWPQNLALGSYSAEGGSQRQITMTLIYDRLVIED